MKKTRCIISVLFAMLALLSLMGCGQGNGASDGEKPSMNVDVIQNNDGSTSVVKNGSEQCFFTVNDGETVDVEMTFNNQSGTISATIARDGSYEDSAYSGRSIQSGSFTVTVAEAGTYRILYNCEDYIGEYSYTTNVR